MTPLRLSIVVPTYNEAGNVRELLKRLDESLGTEAWEVLFVDDDSPDGTANLVRHIASTDCRVRCLQRIGRRGLSTACIEGMLASAAPIIAIMDGDLQHDESVLPKMLAEVEQRGADIVVGTRYGAGGSTGDWEHRRKAMSRLATVASRAILKQPVSDPMSGFFLIRRSVLDETVRGLSGLGFKILLDILATATRSLRIAEVPFLFKTRFSGASKLDELVVWEYGMLLAEKRFGRFVPVRFLAFSAIGAIGIGIHFAVLGTLMSVLGASFSAGQAVATTVAMIFNFAVNNVLTYRDRRLRGWSWLKGLCSFVLVCAIGAFANVSVSTYLFRRDAQWAVAALAGILISAGWNFAATRFYTWGEPPAPRPVPLPAVEEGRPVRGDLVLPTARQ
jgi:dolichol-phosphate mannosyltransferase